MTAVMELRKFMKAAAAERDMKLTVLPIILKATSLALEQFPVLNARIHEDGSNVTYVAEHNLSVAIDTPRGLLVPNVKAVQVPARTSTNSTKCDAPMPLPMPCRIGPPLR